MTGAEGPSAVGEPKAPAPPSPLDVLLISPEEAERRARTQAEAETPAAPEAAEAPDLLAVEIERIVKAIERLSRKGLNLRAVIALLHDANPSIPKKSIKAVLESLRELPAIYGREQKSRP